MTDGRQSHNAREVEELKAFAHPMRQRILTRLRDNGPATSTTLARDLSENSGIMSYHLRLLAGNGFVREVSGRGHGRERWWEVRPEPTWISREGLSVEAQAEVSGLRLPHLAADIAGFERFRAAREEMGDWGHGTWVSGRTTLMLTREEAAQLIADQQKLADRYRREGGDLPPGTRAVAFRFLIYPEPATSDEVAGQPQRPGDPGDEAR